MYVIEWQDNRALAQRGGVIRRQYFDRCSEDGGGRARGVWSEAKKSGYRYKTKGDCVKDIGVLGFVHCVAVCIAPEVSQVLADEIKKNLLANIKTAEKELSKDEYTAFLDSLVINLAEVAEDCTQFVHEQLNSGTTALPIVAPIPQRAVKKKAAKKRLPKKKAPKKRLPKVAKKRAPKKRAPKKKVAKKGVRWG